MPTTLATKFIPKNEGEQLLVLVDNITVKVSNDDSYGYVTFVETNNEEGAGVPPHYHTREDEIFYVVEGEVEFLLNGERVIAKTGDTIFAPRNIPHAYTFLKQTKMTTTIVPGGFDEMFREVNAMDQSNPEEVVKVFNKYGVYLAE
jgi:quercetin dioxygenase-like cupin family protein